MMGFGLIKESVNLVLPVVSNVLVPQVARNAKEAFSPMLKLVLHAQVDATVALIKKPVQNA